MATWNPETRELVLDGPATVAWNVRWTNSEGTADSAGSVVVAEVGSTLPPAPAADDWRLAPSYGAAGTTVYLAVDRVPTDATAIEYRKDGGAWTPLDYVAPGVFTVSGWTKDVAASVELRFVNASGEGPASAAKSVTPVARSNTLFACWADGEVRHYLTTEPTAAKATSPVTAGAGCNAPFAVVGGGEAEVLRWGTSEFKTRWAPHQYQGTYWAAPVDPGDSIFYDPLGSARSLRPCEIATRTFYTSIGATEVKVLGAAGMVLWDVNGLVGFTAARLPVIFRFDRTMRGGRLPDRRPFVVGPVRIVHNGGDPITITPDATKGYTLVSLDGAALCVVARAGIIPPLTASAANLKVVHGYDPAYRQRRVVANQWAAWDDAAAAAASTSNVFARPTFETVGLYCTLSGTGTCSVRFRKQGDANWYPAMDLWYDDRDHSAYPSVSATNGAGSVASADVLAAKHRGLIVYLEPGATYEYQIKQGDTYRKGVFTTWTHDVTRTSVALGDCVGDVEIKKVSTNIEITRPAPLSKLIVAAPGAGEWLELHSGSVIGTVTIDPSVGGKVIFADIDRFGGGADGFVPAPGMSDVRVLGGRSSGAGSKDTYWAAKNDAEISIFNKPSCHSIVAIGRFFGSPRYCANSWGERRADNSGHPYGFCVFARHQTTEGRLVMSDCAVRADGWRTYGDIFHGGGNNQPTVLGTVADTGPDFCVAWNSFAGWIDDAIEFEGLAANGVHIHNRYDATEMRPGTYLVSVVSHSWVAAGPVLGARNVMVYGADDGRPQNTGVNIKMHKDQANKYGDTDPAWASSKMGRRYYYHETVVGRGGLIPKTAVDGSGGPVLGAHVRNALHQAKGSFAPTGGTNLTSSYRTTTAATLPADLALDADLKPTGSGLVGAGEWIPNINDGGPFYAAAPSVGALRAG